MDFGGNNLATIRSCSGTILSLQRVKLTTCCRATTSGAVQQMAVTLLKNSEQRLKFQLVCEGINGANHRLWEGPGPGLSHVRVGVNLSTPEAIRLD